MKALLRKYGEEILRDLLSLAVFFVAVFTGGDTARIAPLAIALLLLLSVGLLTMKSARYLTLPFLHLSLLLIFCYDSFSVFIKYIWLAPVVVIAMAVYLIRRRPKLVRGASFLPLVAVSVATLLGGIGTIPPGDYFRPASLVFMAGLGPGLIFSYWIMKHELRDPDARAFFMGDLLRWGLVAAGICFAHMLPLLVTQSLFAAPVPQWSNNVATMLMIALPAAFATKKRRLYHYGMALFMYAAVMLIGSRGGQILVEAELILCCLWAWLTEQDYIKRLWSRTYFLYAVMLVGYVMGVFIYNAVALDLIADDEVRWGLLARGFEDFAKNPLFGSGLGYRGNADLFSGKQGTINWYHIFLSQVVGGLGLCGILAWGYQLYTRFCLSRYVWQDPEFGFALCYVGLFLMSMVNPGEFCPVPYAFLAICFFAAIENRTEERTPALIPACLYRPWRRTHKEKAAPHT